MDRLRYTYIGLCWAVLGLFTPLISNASGIVAGDLSYSCTDSNLQAYQFDLKVYVDCQSGYTAQPGILMDYSSSCLSSDLTLVLIDSSFEINTCNGLSNCCSSPGIGCNNAIKEFHYRGSINNLPRCTDWTFTSQPCCLSQFVSTLSSPVSNNGVFQCRLDNLSNNCNSLPTLSSSSILQVCVGENYSWLPGAIDPDGDSLVFELTTPLRNSFGVPVSYNTGYSHNQPIDLSSSFLIDGNTGELSFTASSPNSGITSVRISEFRGGNVISTSEREILIWAINCTNQAPEVSQVFLSNQVTRLDSLGFGFCPGLSGTVNIQFSDPDFDSVFVLERIGSYLPGALTSAGTNQLSITWAPALSDTGSYLIPLELRDNGCTYPRSNQFYLSFQVGNVLGGGPDTASYCSGGVELQANIGNSFSWSPATGLSSAIIANPIANPVNPTWYTVSNGCGSDSVYIDVRGPDYTVDAGSDFSLCQGLSDTISVSIVNTPPGQLITWTGAVTGQIGEMGIVNSSSNGWLVAEVTDSRGCLVRDSIFLSRTNPNWGFNFTPISPRCFNSSDGAVMITPIAGFAPFDFQISGLPTQDTGWFPNLGASSYQFRIYDSARCDTTVRYQLSAPSQVILNQIIYDTPTCNSSRDGRIQIIASGGIGPYQYKRDAGAFQVSGNYTNLSGGNYDFIYRDSRGCLDSVSLNLPSPVPFENQVLSIDTASCRPDGAFQFQTNGGVLPISSFVNGSGVNPGLIDSLSAGTQILVSVDNNGCGDTTAVVIPGYDSLEITSQTTDLLCFGSENGQIIVSAIGGNSPYQYSINSQPFGPIGTFDSLNAGSYSIRVSDSRNCEQAFQLSLNQPAPLQLQVIANNSPCYNEAQGSLQLIPSGGNLNYEFELSSSGGFNQSYQTGLINNLRADSYEIVLTDLNGCELIDSVVIVQPMRNVYQILVDSVSCYNEEDGTISIIAIPPAGEQDKLPYEYSIKGVSFKSSGIFNLLGAGDYPIVVKDNEGCMDTISQNVPGPEKIFFDASPDVLEVTQGQSVDIYAQLSGLTPKGFSIFWTPSEGLSCSDCLDPTVSAFEDQTYHALITDLGTGCIVRDSVVILIKEPAPVFVPNVFTPNGDGINDVLYVYGNDVLSFEIRVFNRWGEKVFGSNSFFDGWDGSFKGSYVKNGVYQYRIEGTYLSGEYFQHTGNISVLR